MSRLKHYASRWYDRYTRTWIVQRKDAAGNQIGDATFVHSSREAKAESHRINEEIRNGK